MQNDILYHIIGSKIIDSKVNHISESTKKIYLESGIVDSLIQLASADFKKGERVEPHFHETMTEVFYIVSGEMEVTLGNKSFLTSLGDVIIAKSKIVHSFRFKEDTKLVYFGLEDYS